MEAIDIILPLRVFEGRNDLERCVKGLIPSLLKLSYDKVVKTVYVVAPECEIDIVRATFKIFPLLFFDFMTDESLSKEIGFSPEEFSQIPGWFRQQLLKLAITRRCTADLILVMDADVIAVKKLPDWLTSDTIPYQVMGTQQFESWFRMSSQALAIDYEQLDDKMMNKAMGVTPELLSRKVLDDLFDYLRTISGSESWGRRLMKFCHGYDHTWTEFSLYWVFISSKKYIRVNYVRHEFYTFVENVALLERGWKNFETTFVVLQSTKLSLEDCAPIYNDIDGSS